jgi:hypothetical protein
MKAIVDALSESRASLRDRASKDEERREAARTARAEFRRSTLLDLQEECQKLARAAGRINHEDVMGYKRTSTWQRELLSEQANDRSREAFAAILKLRVRVDDEEIRSYTQEFTNACSGVVRATSEATSNKELAQAMRIQETLYERIGEVLRGIH